VPSGSIERVERSDFLSGLRRDGEALAAACERAGLDVAVPSCPGWDLGALCWHVAGVAEFWANVVAERAAMPGPFEPRARPADDVLVADVRGVLGRLAELLASTDPATPIWNWTGTDQTAGWVVRRVAHEVAVHRWDAEHAVGDAHTIEATLASDGIDEFLTCFLVGEPGTRPDGSVHLHCGDVPGEWTLRPSGAGYEITREHAKGDCAIRGTANDILLALWRRRPVSSVDVVGDTDLAARFLSYSVLI
jgi:uncharacterized protein (TIGR03083 family)